MQMKTRMLCKLGFNIGMIVCAIVVEDHVNVQFFGHLAIDPAQELQKLEKFR